MECQIFSNVITFAIRKATKEILDYEIIWGLCWMQGKEIQFLLALGELVINWDNSLIKSNLPSGGVTKEPSVEWPACQIYKLNFFLKIQFLLKD